MQTMRLWAQGWRSVGAIFVLCFSGLSAVTPAGAQDLPSSATPPKGVWETMVPSSFQGTIADALRQCKEQAGRNPADQLTVEKCFLMEAQLSAGQCEVVPQVPDGIVCDYLSGLQHGKSHVWQGMEKRLGRTDRALLCDLGDNVYTYWFTGIQGQSCNNICSVIEEPEAGELVCFDVPFDGGNDPHPGSHFHLYGVYHPHACGSTCGCNDALYIPDLHLQFQETQESNGTTEVCVPARNFTQ